MRFRPFQSIDRPSFSDCSFLCFLRFQACACPPLPRHPQTTLRPSHSTSPSSALPPREARQPKSSRPALTRTPSPVPSSPSNLSQEGRTKSSGRLSRLLSRASTPFGCFAMGLLSGTRKRPFEHDLLHSTEGMGLWTTSGMILSNSSPPLHTSHQRESKSYQEVGGHF